VRARGAELSSFCPPTLPLTRLTFYTNRSAGRATSEPQGRKPIGHRGEPRSTQAGPVAPECTSDGFFARESGQPRCACLAFSTGRTPGVGQTDPGLLKLHNPRRATVQADASRHSSELGWRLGTSAATKLEMGPHP